MGTKPPTLGYETTRSWIQNDQTLGYETTNLGTERPGYEMTIILFCFILRAILYMRFFCISYAQYYICVCFAYPTSSIICVCFAYPMRSLIILVFDLSYELFNNTCLWIIPRAVQYMGFFCLSYEQYYICVCFAYPASSFKNICVAFAYPARS